MENGAQDSEGDVSRYVLCHPTQPATGSRACLNLPEGDGVITSMIIDGIDGAIAGVTLIITGFFLGYDGLWGALTILLGVLLSIFWLARKGGML